MPSSLVFAALVLAWIVVLVPMVARRRQEVRRTADSALAARVLRRGDGLPHAPPQGRIRPEEVLDMPETDEYAHHADGPRYRPGRGGFDPHAAELAARARYALRQRVVLALLVVAVATGLLAAFVLPLLWWVHGTIDVALVGYLAYLRRQVRIEQEIRQRRIDRAARSRRRTAPTDVEEGTSADLDGAEDHEPQPQPEPARAPHRPSTPPGTTLVDLDDEDPELHHLDDTALAYRRAVGE